MHAINPTDAPNNTSETLKITDQNSETVDINTAMNTLKNGKKRCTRNAIESIFDNAWS